MSCFRNALFIFFVALVSPHKAVDATDYEIPEACRTDQVIQIDGGTMNGSTLIYKNSRNLTVHFRVSLSKFNNPKATVTYYTNTETVVSSASFKISVEKKSISFSLTGNWLNSDMGTILYYADAIAYEDCYDRTATKLLVLVIYDVQVVNQQMLTIRARDECGVKVVLDGVLKDSSDKCTTTLDFSGVGKYDASLVGMTVTTENNLLSYKVYSNCLSADVMLYYQENCPSITTKSTEQSAISSSQTTKTPESTAPASTTTESKSESTVPTSTTTTKTPESTAPASTTSFGVNAMVRTLLIIIALTLAIIQW